MMNSFKKGLLLVLAGLCLSFIFPPQKPVRVIYIGDSITAGAGLSDREHQAPPFQCTAILQRKLKGGVSFSNQGHSGFTTTDFLPGTKAFNGVIDAAKGHPDEALVFSIMLGTNDSAEQGPNGAPLSPERYESNMQVIIAALLSHFPDAKIVVNRPLWYSDNTYNRSKYLKAGQNRLALYFPQIKSLVNSFKQTRPNSVFLGDTSALEALKKHREKYYEPENGQAGVFYLHPNIKGAQILGRKWGKAILQVVNHQID